MKFFLAAGLVSFIAAITLVGGQFNGKVMRVLLGERGASAAGWGANSRGKFVMPRILAAVELVIAFVLVWIGLLRLMLN